MRRSGPRRSARVATCSGVAEVLRRVEELFILQEPLPRREALSCEFKRVAEEFPTAEYEQTYKAASTPVAVRPGSSSETNSSGLTATGVEGNPCMSANI